jgi:4-amino-4-deoxy-L-arabinose transferase-like glycosyltransferase
LTANPPSLYWDEASIGYNAYSILKTGQDEWGTSYPLNFRAFGEFKLPVYIYTVAVFEFILGPTELAVRLPAVLFSLVSVFLTFLIGRKIYDNKIVGLVAAFVVTIIPWWFLISRVGYEANSGLMFYLLGVYLWLHTKKWRFGLFAAVISFGLSLYSYNSFRIVTPLTITFLLLTSRPWEGNIREKWRALLLSGILMALILIPVIKFTLTENSRFQTVGIFNQPSSQIVKAFTLNYLSHLSPDFLLISGDKNLRSHIGYGGSLYWPLLPLLVIGIYASWKNKIYLPLVLVLIGIIPAAITKESPHVLRTVAVFLSYLC